MSIKLKVLLLAYFNPEDKRYHHLKIPEYSVQIEQDKDSNMGLGSGTLLSKEEVKLLGKDIRYIKENHPKFSQIGALPYHFWHFYALIIFPLFGLALSVVYRNYQDKMSSNIKFARSKKASKQAQIRLKEAKLLLKQNKISEFYGEVSRALLGYVADKTNQSAAGFLRDDVIAIFEARNVDEQLFKDYLACLDEADFRRFAPGSVSGSDQQDFYTKAEQILTRLGKYI